MEKLNNTISCFKENDGQSDGLPGGYVDKREDDQDEEISGPLEAIYCKTCGQAVTSKDHKIVVQSSHTHTFFNPAGIVFELGCFSIVPGCYSAGEATSDFSWFAGYTWRFALCGGCNSHLGWFFDSDGYSFFGLILAGLRE